MNSSLDSVIIIGAGPAGLSAGLELSKNQITPRILEGDLTYVGGISKTVRHKGFCFDIGGHRFYSPSKEINALWKEILPNDLIERQRSSKIYYQKQFFAYPLNPVEVLSKLGAIEATLCLGSYLKSFINPQKPVVSFEDWVVNQFGDRLFRTFFKTYTEKVWGMKCNKISADWARERIGSLSFRTILSRIVLPRSVFKYNPIKTYIDSFLYPRMGPGMMWEACAHQIATLGGVIQMDQRVTSLSYDSQSQMWTVTSRNSKLETEVNRARHVISTMPLKDLASMVSPPLSSEALQAAETLKYRDFLVVNFILDIPPGFGDQWLYVHDPSVHVARIQNMGAWSSDMVPSPKQGALSLEFFCSQGDSIWEKSDDQLINLAGSELEQIGLISKHQILEGFVIRQKKAYPVYDNHYSKAVALLRNELSLRYPQLITIGRNGLHKYNNQDHAMMTGLIAARNILQGKNVYDVWDVNLNDSAENRHLSDRIFQERQTPMPLEDNV